MSIAATDEQLALQGAIRDWAKRAGTRPMVRPREPGQHPASRPSPPPTNTPSGPPPTSADVATG